MKYKNHIFKYIPDFAVVKFTADFQIKHTDLECSLQDPYSTLMVYVILK